MKQESFVQRLQNFAFMIYISVTLFSKITSSKPLTQSICDSKECDEAAYNLKLWMDVSVDPCHDFYRYVCGNHKNPPNYDKQSYTQRLIDDSLEIIDFLDKKNSEDEPEEVHKARKLYNRCLNMEISKEQLKHLNIPSLNSMDYEYLDSFFKVGGKALLCAYFIKSKFYLAISYLHTQKEKYRNAKVQVTEILKYIRKTFAKIIEQVTWMDAGTKRKALRKLAFMIHYIVYPAADNDLRELLKELYHDVNIDENHPLEIMSKLKSISDYNQKKALDEHNNDPSKEINMLATVNLFGHFSPFYQPKINLIGVPASEIGPPIYGNGLKALDFGSMGGFLGHEMMHAFAPRCRTTNEYGIEENWWSETSSRIYNEKIKCFHVPAKKNTNKEKDLHSLSTLDDDFSDHGGFHLALRAYRNYVSEKGEEPSLVRFENFTHEQLFTLEFAHQYCIYPLSLAYIRDSNDPHSSDEARVNGVVKNSKDFAEIWKCPKGSRMNPSAKCSFW